MPFKFYLIKGSTSINNIKVLDLINRIKLLKGECLCHQLT